MYSTVITYKRVENGWTRIQIPCRTLRTDGIYCRSWHQLRGWLLASSSNSHQVWQHVLPNVIYYQTRAGFVLNRWGLNHRVRVNHSKSNEFNLSLMLLKSVFTRWKPSVRFPLRLDSEPRVLSRLESATFVNSVNVLQNSPSITHWILRASRFIYVTYYVWINNLKRFNEY